MHRKVQRNTAEDADSMPHQEIVPDAAFIVGPDCVFSGAAFSRYTYEAQFKFSDELSVAVNPSIYTGTTIRSEVPLLIVEYVKNYGAEGWKSHLVHLSMAMKSAMGILCVLALPSIILGLLVDGFRIPVVCCSRSEVEDLVTELPGKYDFDLDIFRLRRCMRNVWKLAHEIERLDQAAHVEVEKSISSGTFSWWKEGSDQLVGSNQMSDVVHDWCTNVASKASH
ncbi:hypothetical protein DFS33DRAFT_1079353 [Desarmillaria ectypa]|nr:hypothetical protein DFS33DRAFT_1079353 [Desarmillaria ectypa]